ncbi:MAG: NYN domain-containing protein [Intestinibacter sp.]|uniref:NYN domain-containing protein n=1 Tax=Intestinibacter sp. TaxID=1965304 RepID=UPI003F13C243
MTTNKKNIIVYVDYENLHYNLINKNQNIFEKEFFQKLKKFLEINNYNVLDIIAYCNFDIEDMHESYHQTKLQQLGLKTIHTCNNSKNYADVQIATDAIEQMYINDIADGFAIISNDKDMTPLIKSIKNHKEFVLLITTKDNFDKNLLNFPTENYFIEDIIEEIKDSYGIDNLKHELYKNLNDYIEKSFINLGKEPFISVDRYIKNIMKHYKVFEYEIYRQFKELNNKEKKIYVYTYKYEGKIRDNYIITDNYKEKIETLISEDSTKYSDLRYIDIDKLIQKSYKKYQKK